MERFTAKYEIITIILFVIVLTFFTIFRIKNSQTLSPLAKTSKNLTLVRETIDEFYSIYKRYPTDEEIRGLDDNEIFISVLNHNINGHLNFLKKTEFPKTSEYTKLVDGIEVNIAQSNNIKICKKLETLGLDINEFSSNGGWIYCPLNGEFRANLQNGEAKDKKESDSRPQWGKDIDWYYR